MSNHQQGIENTDTHEKRFLTRLSEYREFIAILVFFTLGLMWIYGFFATKKQLAELKCLMTHNISMIDSQMQSTFVLDDLTANGIEQEKLAAENDLSNGDKARLVRLRNEAEVLKERLKKAHQEYEDCLDFLRSDGCQSK